MFHEIPVVEHVEPATLDKAVYWLSKYGDRAGIIAGGTDLLGLVKDNITGPRLPPVRLLVNIKKIPELKRLQYGLSGLRIGAAVTLAELEESPIVREKFPIIAEAASSVATRQIRNMGTIAGNLCQKPWCSYFRSPLFQCFKKGGEQCYAVSGEHRYYFLALDPGVCIASHPSDLAPALTALGASLSIRGPEGIREVRMENFFNGPNDVLANVLEPHEIISEIHVPNNFEGAKGCYLKDSIRGAWDLSLASVAVIVRMSGRICDDARIVLGGLASSPYRANEAEVILRNREVNEELATKAAQKALEKAKGLRMTQYKLGLAVAIVRRGILRAIRGAADSP